MGVERSCADTNIFFYALNPAEQQKHLHAVHALELMFRGNGVLLLQSLGELCNSVARKRPQLFPAAQRYALKSLTAFPIVAAHPDDLADALAAREEHGLQFWDAMLWATARRARCTLFLSEDMQDGRILGGVTFRNPFKMSSDELKALLS